VVFTLRVRSLVPLLYMSGTLDSLEPAVIGEYRERRDLSKGKE